MQRRNASGGARAVLARLANTVIIYRYSEGRGPCFLTMLTTKRCCRSGRYNKNLPASAPVSPGWFAPFRTSCAPRSALHGHPLGHRSWSESRLTPSTVLIALRRQVVGVGRREGLHHHDGLASKRRGHAVLSCRGAETKGRRTVDTGGCVNGRVQVAVWL